MCSPHATNLWVSRIVPVVIVAIDAYSIWVVVDRLCLRYLLKPGPSLFDLSGPLDQELELVPRRPKTAIAILAVYFPLMLLCFLTYFRILQSVITNPGFIPRRASNSHHEEGGPGLSSKGPEVARSGGLDRVAVLEGRVLPPPGLDRFYNKDVWVCDQEGLPIFCDTCNNWKPARTHHCSDFNRCVRRMDHFCPWVGGVVSETNMKYFLQFTCYGFLYTGFLFGIVIWAIVDRQRRIGTYDGNLIAFAVLSALFGFMTGGMFGHTLHQQLLNLTTIEFLGRGSRTEFLAVYIPTFSRETTQSRTITYPLPNSSTNYTPDATASELENGASAGVSRTFAIIQTKPDDNIWDVGALNNLKSVLGERIWGWFLPFGDPPCCRHDDPLCDFPLGRDFYTLLDEHHLGNLFPRRGGRRRKRKRRTSHHSRHSSREADR
ncbi:zf-DHHC-domain-containing protein [Trichodelitschia bisporula]|uniref:Palmitoyltransferase n=1 Tax=Trichodelitschia bisporula TaxID=703511 RepID=A0A6G1HQ24_9PEZI|nr:zf-DHHC-domain-containing protein [Trichodelitschia bisporula]